MATFSGAAQAQDADRIGVLERKLEQALSLIQDLRAELAQVRATQATATPQAANGNANNDAVAEVSERVDGLEDIVVGIEERIGSRTVLNAFDAKSFDLGGFLHAGTTFYDGPGGSTVSFNRLTLELLGKAKLNEDWSLFFAQAFIWEGNPAFRDPVARRDLSVPGLNSMAPLVIATATYRAGPHLEVDFGRFITPHGIINIEHFPAILLDTEQPQFLRPFGAQTMFPNFQNGVRVSSTRFVGFDGAGRLNLSAYGGVHLANADGWNFGTRAGYTLGNSGVTIGLNGATGNRPDGSGYTLYGADLLIDKGHILWKSEIFATDEDNGGNKLAYYTQPAWRITDQWTAFYRYDFLDNGSTGGDSTENVFGVTYKPIPNIHLRGILTLRDQDASLDGLSPDVNVTQYQLSATLSF